MNFNQQIISVLFTAVLLTNCASSQSARKVKSLISPSPESEVATTTEPQPTEDIPQSSPNFEEKELVAKEPESIDRSASQLKPVTKKEDNKSAGDSLTTQNTQASNKQSQTIPEISWKSSLNSFDLNSEGNIGKQFSFKCPTAPADFQASIWGSDNYTTDSSICLSGVHAGAITRDGGIVTLQLNPGQEFYTGSERNSVTTSDYGSYDPSFSFIGDSVATNNQPSQTTPKPTPTSTENSTEPNSETKSSGSKLIGLEDTPSPNKEMIMDLKNLGVFDNLSWDFNLLEPITRGECMALIYYANNAVRSQANHLRLAPSYDPGFTDIDSSHPTYKYVQALANAGYSVGFPDNTFKPDRPITREELIGIKVPLDIGTQEDKDDNEWDFNDYEQIDSKFKSDINWDNYIVGEKGRNKGSNIERAFGSIKSLKPKQEVWGYEAAATLWQFGDRSGYIGVYNAETAIDDRAE